MRETLFRGKAYTGEWIEGCLIYNLDPSKVEDVPVDSFIRQRLRNLAGFSEVRPETVGQHTGLSDKNGKKIFEGDEILWRQPYRRTQTHTGDNIPNGSYTEPLEPEIEEMTGVVRFENGAFVADTSDCLMPIDEILSPWSEEDIKCAVGFMGDDPLDWFNNDHDGDLNYLLHEYKKDTIEQLCEWVSGIEIIGTIHDPKE